MITGHIKNQIDKLWETFWTGGIANPLTVIEQITFLLFIKRMDDIQIAKEKKATRLGKPIDKPIYTPEESILRWSTFKEMGDPDEIFKIFTVPQETRPGMEDDEKQTAFSKMLNMGEAQGSFSQFMKGATFLIPKSRILESAIAQIDTIDTADQDTKGDIYEYLLSKIATAGTMGQFRTPRHIIKMMVYMMKPSPDDIICDPSAGSMGFLVGCIEYLRKEHKEAFFDTEFQRFFSEDMIHGIEIDPSMVRIGAMNLMLHGLESPNLVQNDSLSEAAGHIKDKYSLVLANPPFKGTIDHDAVDKSITSVVKSKKSELLFLAMMLRTMSVGGRAAVIVPDGVLFGSSKAHKTIRKEIIDNHQLQAIISMPSGVFKPYAGVSTAVMIFTKTGTGGTGKVWFYDMKADGYSLDDKRNQLGSKDEAGEPVQTHDENNISDILSRFSHLPAEVDRKRTDQSFMVPVVEIQENDYDLSINRYKEIIYEKVEYDLPAVIIDRIADLDKERQTLINKLNDMLA